MTDAFGDKSRAVSSYVKLELRIVAALHLASYTLDYVNRASAFLPKSCALQRISSHLSPNHDW